MVFKTVSVIGLGYIGLPTAAVFASRKVRVIGVDVNRSTVETINRGEIHIIEPELDIIVHAVVRGGYLRAATEPEPADAFLLAVPTPFKNDHEPDLSFIESASRSIARVLKRGDLVILESTSPVGATEKMSEWLAQERPDLSFPQTHGEDSDIRVAHCPERVLPGHVLRELVQNDRIIGGMTRRCSEVAVDLYKTFVEGECVITDARTAEMCKLTENSFRDVNIAFANELSIICDELGIDIWELIRLANRHPRVSILQPGPGVGGHCIAVDPWFIVSSAPHLSKIIRQARVVNDQKPGWVLDKVRQAIKKVNNNRGQVAIACLGMTFKANIDDMRESPAFNIVKTLAAELDLKVLVTEPFIKKLPQELAGFTSVSLTDIDEAVAISDIVLVLVDHNIFKEFDVKKLSGKIVIDTRGIWV